MNILITESQYKLITETRHGLLNYLVEGWYRTTSSLKKYGRYKQNAWVYFNN